MNINVASLNVLIAQLVALLKTLAGIGFVILITMTVAEALGFNWSWMHTFTGSGTEKAAMIAALAYALKG